MNKYLFFIGVSLTLFGNASCDDLKTNKVKTQTNATQTVEKDGSEKVVPENVIPTTEKEISLMGFLPKGYIIFDTIYGDLNNDSLEDCIIIIKGTDTSNIIKDEYLGKLDRNRRGVFVFFNKNGRYEVVVKNQDCFSSENEDGGVYFAPDLSVEINKGNLYIHYGHGRYGNWSYTFRFQEMDFELIGYNVTNRRGPVISSEMSINYLTRKKIEKKNINENAEDGEEVFKETITRIKITEPIKLSEVKDFDKFEVL